MPKISSIVGILFWIVLSWILLHFFAVFGIFFALAYPIFWLFFPEQTICFLGRNKDPGEYCSLCREAHDPERGNNPQNLLSAVLNGGLILMFSLLSVGVVFAEKQLLNYFGFPPEEKTVSFVIPSKGQYRLGEIFPLKIEIVGVRTPINAVQADLSFDPKKLEVVDIQTDDSFAKIFIQKEINNQSGYARLTGGLPNPGFFSESGTFGTVLFRGKIPGLANVEFLPSSLVLANDGHGTNVLKDLAKISYLILPDKISSEEEETQKHIVMKPKVLGEEDTATKINLYEDVRVLGAEIGEELEQGGPSLLERLLEFLGKVDSFVINQWVKLTSIGK